MFISSLSYLPDLNVHILRSLSPSFPAAPLLSLPPSLPLSLSLSDIRRIGVILIGHQRRIVSSIQTLRLHMMHIQEKGFHVWKYYKHQCLVPQHSCNERYPLYYPLIWFSKHHFTNCSFLFRLRGTHLLFMLPTWILRSCFIAPLWITCK